MRSLLVTTCILAAGVSCAHPRPDSGPNPASRAEPFRAVEWDLVVSVPVKQEPAAGGGDGLVLVSEPQGADRRGFSMTVTNRRDAPAALAPTSAVDEFVRQRTAGGSSPSAPVPIEFLGVPGYVVYDLSRSGIDSAVFVSMVADSCVYAFTATIDTKDWKTLLEFADPVLHSIDSVDAGPLHAPRCAPVRARVASPAPAPAPAPAAIKVTVWLGSNTWVEAPPWHRALSLFVSDGGEPREVKLGAYSAPCLLRAWQDSAHRQPADHPALTGLDCVGYGEDVIALVRDGDSIVATLSHNSRAIVDDDTGEVVVPAATEPWRELGRLAVPHDAVVEVKEQAP